MVENIQMNIQVLPETKERIREIAKLTYRGYGDPLGWLVAEAYSKIKKVQQENESIEIAITRSVEAVGTESIN